MFIRRIWEAVISTWLQKMGPPRARILFTAEAAGRKSPRLGWTICSRRAR